MADDTTINILMRLKDEVTAGLKGIGDGLRGVGDGVQQTGGKISAMTVALGTTMANVGLQIASNIGQGLADSYGKAVEFDKGMQEIFTLLPNATQDAMNDIKQQALAASAELGKMPEEVVPALYQALSAGIPQDNVFEFLKAANAAAVGGVTSLETAVDGLSSVVNAYGSDVLSTQEASDLMFEAVKLGKTTFDELSTSLGRVAPTAAAMGIPFGDVAAILATTTGQGISTAESVTGLKGVMQGFLKPTEDMTIALDTLLISLGEQNKLTGPAADAYTLMTTSGQSLSDVLSSMGVSSSELLIQSQGLDGVIAGLAEQTGGSATKMGELFSSTEALNTALALTSENGAKVFDGALAAMQDSTGSTQDAFETMQQSVDQKMKLVNASFESVKIQVLDAMLPAVGALLDVFIKNMPAIQGAVEKAFKAIDTVWANVLKPAFDAIGPVVETMFNIITGKSTEGTESINANFIDLANGIKGQVENIKKLFELMVSFWEKVLLPSWNTIEPLVKGIWDAVKKVIDTAVKAIGLVLDGLADFLNGDFTKGFKNMGEAVEKIVEGLFDALTDIMEGLLEMFGDIGEDIVETLTDVGTNLVEGLIGGITGMWGNLEDTVSNTAESVIGWFKDIFGISSPSTVLSDIGQWLLEGLMGGIQNMMSALKDQVTATANGVVGWFKDVFGIESPSKVMAEIGAFLIQGMGVGIEEETDPLLEKVNALTEKLQGNFQSMVDRLVDLTNGDFKNIFTDMFNIVDKTMTDMGIPMDETTKGILKTWAEFGDRFLDYLEKFDGNVLKALAATLIDVIQQKLIEVAVTAAAEIAKAYIMAPLTFGATLAAQAPIGIAAAAGAAALMALKAKLMKYDVGTPYVTHDQIAVVHKGEMIIPRTFAEGIRQGQVALGGGGQTVVNVYLDGRLITQQVSDRMYDNTRRMVKGNLGGVF